MNRSESIKEITKALCEFQSKVKIVAFDSNNPFFKSKYASLSSVLKTAQKELHAQGLSYIQSVEDNCLVTVLMHSSGEFFETSVPLLLSKQDMQGVGAAMTYARRTGLIAMLGLVADEDDDGETDAKPGRTDSPAPEKKTEQKTGTPQTGGKQTTYLIPFGKFRGKALQHIQKSEFENWVKWLKTESDKEGKPLTQPAQDLIQEATKHYGPLSV